MYVLFNECRLEGPNFPLTAMGRRGLWISQGPLGGSVTITRAQRGYRIFRPFLCFHVRKLASFGPKHICDVRCDLYVPIVSVLYVTKILTNTVHGNVKDLQWQDSVITVGLIHCQLPSRVHIKPANPWISESCPMKRRENWTCKSWIIVVICASMWSSHQFVVQSAWRGTALLHR